MACAHQTIVTGKKTWIRCAALTADSGFGRTVCPTLCGRCEQGGRKQSTTFAELYKVGLIARLIAGDAPRYQQSNAVDLDAAFTKFCEIAEASEPAGLLARMFRHQAGLSEDDGGHPPGVFVAKLQTIAEKHKLEAVLDDIISEYEAATD